ncbi:hypothetical protein AHF37_10609 [Paragonimus kellicotti]|nr:hypothetical protein AHF37_10609 [Paragonimus kellicotti]
MPNTVAVEFVEISYGYLQDDATMLVLFNQTEVDLTDLGLGDVFYESGEADRQRFPFVIVVGTPPSEERCPQVSPRCPKIGP